MKGSRGAGEQRSRGAEEQRSRGAGEQGSRGAGEMFSYFCLLALGHLVGGNSQQVTPVETSVIDRQTVKIESI